jgi:hypothetical protein
MRWGRNLGTLALVGSLVGCKAVSALSTQEIVVHLAPNTPRAQHVEIQQKCGGLPHTSPEPIPSVEPPGQDATDVRFLVDPATDANKKRVLDCLAQFPGVVLGYDLPGM